MTNASIIKGNMLMVFYGGAALGFSTNSTATVTTNTTTVTTKDHGDYPSTLAQSISWEITSENLYTNDAATLIAAQLNKQPVQITFAPASNYSNTDEKGIVTDAGGADKSWTAGTAVLSGKALISSISINAPSGDNATYTVTFQGSGSLDQDTSNNGHQGTQGTQGA